MRSALNKPISKKPLDNSRNHAQEAMQNSIAVTYDLAIAKIAKQV